MMYMDAICVVWRHGMWCMDMADVFLWEKNMSSCWRRLYCHGRCLLVGEEHVLLLEKTIWLRVGEECMSFCILSYLARIPSCVCCAVDADLRDQGVRRRGLMIDSKSSGSGSFRVALLLKPHRPPKTPRPAGGGGWATQPHLIFSMFSRKP